MGRRFRMRVASKSADHGLYEGSVIQILGRDREVLVSAQADQVESLELLEQDGKPVVAHASTPAPVPARVGDQEPGGTPTLPRNPGTTTPS